MLKRIVAVTAITSVAIVICTALVQIGATKRTEIEASAQLAIAKAVAGKSTTASINIQVESKRLLKEQLPDASARATAAPALDPLSTEIPKASPTSRERLWGRR